MGLDMYAYVTTTTLTKLVDFPEPRDSEELHYWRKHPDLHGWMEGLYRKRQGRQEEFNLTPVVLTLDDLTTLEHDVRQGALPLTIGFFFGESRGVEQEDDLTFIVKARRAIAEGRTVFYLAWW